MMNSILEIIRSIKQLQESREVILIAIDGLGGSGKTTVTKRLKEKFPEAVIVEMDDFYSPKLKRADYMRLLNQVIIPIKNNQISHYQIYDWKNDKYLDAKSINPTGIIIIEGIFSLAQELIDNYDIKIWVKYSQELGIERGVKRDGEEYRDKWENQWGLAEKKYKETQKPDQKADFIINGAKINP